MKSFSKWLEEKKLNEITTQFDINSLATTITKYFNLPAGSNWSQIAQNLLTHVPGFDTAVEQAKAQRPKTQTTSTTNAATTPTAPAAPTQSVR